MAPTEVARRGAALIEAARRCGAMAPTEVARRGAALIEAARRCGGIIDVAGRGAAPIEAPGLMEAAKRGAAPIVPIAPIEALIELASRGAMVALRAAEGAANFDDKGATPMEVAKRGAPARDR